MDKITKEKFRLPISKIVGVPSKIELNVVEDDKVNKIEKQIKQFHERQTNQETAWIFCWGYLVALKHYSIINENEYEILEKINEELFK